MILLLNTTELVIKLTFIIDLADSEELNILLIGAGDCRHIIKTLAHLYRHPARRINASLCFLSRFKKIIYPTQQHRTCKKIG